MKTLMITMLMIFAVQSAEAGREAGGGKGVMVGDKLYLYDFFEAGLEERATVDTGMQDLIGAEEKVNLSLAGQFGEETLLLIVKKMNEIHRKFPRVAEKLLKTLEAYEWRTVNARVFDANDIGNTPLAAENGMKEVAIAVRDDEKKVVTINNVVLTQMPEMHVAGLVFHEIFYALMREDDVAENGTRHHRRDRDENNTSEEARIVTAFVFDARFPLKSREVAKEKFALIDGLKKIDYVTGDEDRHMGSREYKEACASAKATFKARSNNMRALLDHYADFRETIARPIGDWTVQQGYGRSTLTIDGEGLLKDNSYYGGFFGTDDEQASKDKPRLVRLPTKFPMKYWCKSGAGFPFSSRRRETCTREHAYSADKAKQIASALTTMQTHVKYEADKLYGRCFTDELRKQAESFMKIRIEITERAARE